MLKINGSSKVESACLPNETKDEMWGIKLVEIIPVDTDHLDTKGLS